MAQRLTNGNTFVATAYQLVEWDANGKTVFTFTPPDGHTIMKAMKLPNGEAIYMTSDLNNDGPVRVAQVDGNGKVMGLFNLNLGTRLSGGRIQVLANGNMLIPLHGENKVVEYDREG